MNINNIRPIGNQVLIEVIPPDKETKGGILLPDNQLQHGYPVRAIIHSISKKVYEEDEGLWGAMDKSKEVLVHLHLGAAGTKRQLDDTHYLVDKELILAIL